MVGVLLHHQVTKLLHLPWRISLWETAKLKLAVRKAMTMFKVSSMGDKIADSSCTPTKKRPWKSDTNKPSSKEHCCPFKFTVFLGNDGFWYLKLSKSSISCGCNHPSFHIGHEKIAHNHINTRTSCITEDDADVLNQYGKAQLSSTQSAHLLSKITSSWYYQVRQNTCFGNLTCWQVS